MTLPALAEAVTAGHERVVELRRTLHAEPELGFEEHRTTATLLDDLLAAGLERLPCPTPTGAVLALSGGRPGRTVLLRADIDALPLQEETPVAFRSRIDGRMHACGHDGHAAMLVGVAHALRARQAELPGRYVLLFQPAEEMGGGARRMVEGGVLDGLGAERMLSVHLVSLMPSGFVAARPGMAMAEANLFRLELRGEGGHGAASGPRGNVLLAAAALAGRLAGVVAGMSYEDVPCSCSAGALHAGTAPNVIPNRATIQGTLRTFTEPQRQRALALLFAICREASDEFAVRAECQVLLRVPAVVNDAEVTGQVRTALVRELGGPNVLLPPPVAPSDDVSELLSRIPGCHLFVGAAPKDRYPPPAHHTADFDIDEGALEIGTRALAAAAVDLATPS
jgi:amidohydrolase